MKLLLASTMLLALSAYAHDEGHGPKLSDTGKYGGVVSPVVDYKDADKGAKAPLVYKSELVRNEDGTINLYLYDQSMNPLAFDKLSAAGNALIGPMKKSPKWKTENFKLEKKGNFFSGKMPKVKLKPFFIDITIPEGGRKLLTAYDNLD